ncbi:thioredoxin-like protein 1, partial [Rozella allomycis CSF55]
EYDIKEFIDVKQVHCLNQDAKHTVHNIFKKEGFLKSDCDEQLLINIPFLQNVKLHSIKISGPKGKAPKTIRFYVNRLTMGFDEVDSIEPTQTIQLDEKDIGKVVPLRFVKFQNVHTVVIFIEDNQAGDDETIIENIQIIGQTIQGTNMGDFNKKEEQ